MQGRAIQDQDKIIERIEEFYTELYNGEQSNRSMSAQRYASTFYQIFKYLMGNAIS